jgi:archaellum component FlaC
LRSGVLLGKSSKKRKLADNSSTTALAKRGKFQQTDHATMPTWEIVEDSESELESLAGTSTSPECTSQISVTMSEDIEDDSQSLQGTVATEGDGLGHVDETLETLEGRISRATDRLNEVKHEFNRLKKSRTEIMEKLARLRKDRGKYQKEKNAICSFKRSEVCDHVYSRMEHLSASQSQYSRGVLKQDFRAGLQQLDGTSKQVIVFYTMMLITFLSSIKRVVGREKKPG